LNDSIIKASNSFITAKACHFYIRLSNLLVLNADNQDELDAIKRLKTFHISSEDVIK